MMATKQETLRDLLLAEFFSVIVSLGLYIFLINQMSEKVAVLTTCAILLMVTLVSFRKSYATLAMASFVAICVLFIAGLSGTYFGSGGLRPVIFSAGLGYFTLMAFPLGMVVIGLKYRWSAISLFAEGMLVWVGFSHIPKFF